MKRMLFALAVVAAMAVPAYAGVVAVDPQVVNPANRVLTGDDSDVALLFVFPQGPGSTAVTASTTTVEVDADSINLLVTGVAATGIKCPSGGTAGEIDITNAACDTFGEIVDHVNASASGWKAIILDGLRTDAAYATSKKLLTTAATTGVTALNAGVQIKWDTSAMLHSTQALVPPEARVASYYLQGNELKAKPFFGSRGFVAYATSTASTCTAAGIQAIYSVVPVNGDSGSETVVTEYQIAASGTSAVPSDFTYNNLIMPRDSKIVLRRSCGTGFVNAYLSGQAYYLPVRR